jgi:hypothetical protein
MRSLTSGRSLEVNGDIHRGDQTQGVDRGERPLPCRGGAKALEEFESRSLEDLNLSVLTMEAKHVVGSR